MALAEQILANEKVMDRLAREYAQVLSTYYGNGKRGNDTEAKKEMIYVLEQECGVCQSPASIGTQLMKIWDKIQILAKQKYGYDGPIYQPKSDELPDYLKEKAERLRSNPELMTMLGQSYYWLTQSRTRAWDMSEKNEYSYPNELRMYPEYKNVVGYLSFKEAKAILKYLEKDIKAEAKKHKAKLDAEKASLTEAIYKNVLKKLLRNG